MKRASDALRGAAVFLAALAAGGLGRAQTTERVSVSSSGVQGNSDSYRAAISADGRVVAFDGLAGNLVPGDTHETFDVFVHDRSSGTTELVSVDGALAPGNSPSTRARLSADGRFVSFHSSATNLVAGDVNGKFDVFLRDRASATTELVSVGPGGVQGDDDSDDADVSADGRFVAFVSLASNLVAGDTNGWADVFVRDRLSATTERVSLGPGGVQGNARSGYYGAAISADGRFVVFQSYATNLVAGDTNGQGDIFVHDRLTATTERVSVATGGAEGNAESGYNSRLSVSADGRFVAFHSSATNLVTNDTNAREDIFVRDRLAGTTERANVAPGGIQADLGSLNPSLSADGRFVVFSSWATNLVAGDTNARMDVFVRDRASDRIALLSVNAAGDQGDDTSLEPSISADGRAAAFHSLARNLVAGDTNARFDVFVRDLGAVLPASPFCFGDGTGAACPCGNYGAPGRNCENSAMTGGALLTAAGRASLTHDTLELSMFGGRPNASTLFLQGATAVNAAAFGDGLFCIGGSIRRMYQHGCIVGIVGAPSPGDPSVSARSAATGDVLSAGMTRYYQAYYRDAVLTFCPDPLGDSWNASSALSVVWEQ